jgi:hypothetical protein
MLTDNKRRLGEILRRLGQSGSFRSNLGDITEGLLTLVYGTGVEKQL